MHDEGLHSPSLKTKNKKGLTKLKNIAMDGDKVEVIFNSKGQPIYEGSISLSSFFRTSYTRGCIVYNFILEETSFEFEISIMGMY